MFQKISHIHNKGKGYASGIIQGKKERRAINAYVFASLQSMTACKVFRGQMVVDHYTE